MKKATHEDDFMLPSSFLHQLPRECLEKPGEPDEELTKRTIEMFNQRAADASWEIFGPDAAPLTRVGLPVFDRDHNQVGKVAEVTRVAFRVDVPWDSDLWLGYDVIGTVLPGQYLELIITCGQLDRFNIPPSVAAA